LTQTEFAAQAAVVARATELPVLCDADTGFGEALNVERTVRLYEEAGVAGLHLEDQMMPKRCGHLSGKSLIDSASMAAKIRAAVSARRDPDFVVIARTDAAGVEGFDKAVRRAHEYKAAGADMIFPEALESAEQFARFAHEVKAPLLANMTEFGRSPLVPFNELAAMGYTAAIYPLSAFRAAMKAAAEVLSSLRDHGTQRSLLDKMQTRAELYDLLGYRDWEARDQAYFTAQGSATQKNE
jgi:methylisocitrate lyase